MYQSAEIAVSYCTVVNNAVWPHTYCMYVHVVYFSTSSNMCTCTHILLLCCISLYVNVCYSLSRSNISDEGVRAIADSMKYCKSLQTLE